MATFVPYNSWGTDSTTNANDHVFTGETTGENLVIRTGDSTSRYIGTCTISLPITAA